MDWSSFSQQALRTEAQRKLIETERVVHNSMIDLESHLGGADPEEKVDAEVEEGAIPQFWLYAGPVNLVCQWCDTSVFGSDEDADFADLEKVVRDHLCDPSGRRRQS